MKTRLATKGVLFTVCFLLLVLGLTGCISSKKSSGDAVVELSFADAVSLDEIKKLDGKTVTILGFMSTTSPLDGSYMYLQNMPYQSCPFCIPNTNTLANTIAIYAPEGQSFKFQDVPIRVTGEVKIGDVADDLGYYYYYRIVDAKIERAEISGMGKEIRVYTELVDRGFGTTFTSIMEDIYRALNHEQLGMDIEDLEPISTGNIEELRNMFNGLNKDDYTDILDVMDRLELLLEKVNDSIERQDWLDLYYDYYEAQEVYNQFYQWLVKPSI